MQSGLKESSRQGGKNRRAGMPSIPLKAIVTPQNVNWTFRALYKELEREHEAMQKLKQQKVQSDQV